jgi:hypothetical protein
MIKLSTSIVSHIDSVAPLANPEVHHAVANRQPHPFTARVIDPDVNETCSLFAYAFVEQKYGWHHTSSKYAEALLGFEGVSPALNLDERVGHIHCIGGVRHG